MDQTVDQIEDQIEDSREDLRSNLDQLGQTVKSAVDWRQKFRASPGAILAVAFGGGLILATVVGGSRSRDESSHGAHRAAVRESARYKRGALLRAWEDIERALVALAATKVSNALAEFVPGLKEQLRSREYHRRAGNGASGEH
jgi:hypothetical protein